MSTPSFTHNQIYVVTNRLHYMGAQLPKRSLLVGLSSVFTLATGCTAFDERGRNNSNGDQHPEESSETETTCGKEGRWNASTNSKSISYGSSGGFELSSSPSVVQFGEPVTFRLVNESAKTRETGPSNLYDIEGKDEGEWRTIFSEAEPIDGELIRHGPGEGFEWSFVFSSSEATGTGRPVCGPLTSGDYRFIYIGISSDSADDVATKFEIQEQ